MSRKKKVEEPVEEIVETNIEEVEVTEPVETVAEEVTENVEDAVVEEPVEAKAEIPFKKILKNVKQNKEVKNSAKSNVNKSADLLSFLL